MAEATTQTHAQNSVVVLDVSILIFLPSLPETSNLGHGGRGERNLPIWYSDTQEQSF